MLTSKNRWTEQGLPPPHFTRLRPLAPMVRIEVSPLIQREGKQNMKLLSVVVLAPALALSTLASGQIKPVSGKVFIPDSSIEKPSDLGKRAHTNVRLFLPNRQFSDPQPFGPPFSGYAFESPASLACVYGITKLVKGCDPNSVTANPTGGAKMIAIVDAYDAPNAASDLAFFSTQFGLPAPSFEVVYASGTKPTENSGWEIEESLDVQWAHAMAPEAKIVLVEAASNSTTDLMTAENVASKMVNAAGGGEVSNSWGQSEFSTETGYDSNFVKSGVVFVASTGDAPGTFWPGVSPNVVAAGGTTVRRNPSTALYLSQDPWDEEGGGVSLYEARPSYQSGISSIVGSGRGVPDIAFDANPITGVWVYVSDQGGWYIVGGTSVAAPSVTGIINSAGGFATSTSAELTTIYGNLGVATDFTDLTTGFCGPYSGYSAVKGWDFCSGVGLDKGLKGK
jgi:kumamolisin